MDLSILKNKSVQLSAVLSAGNFFYAFYDRVNRDLLIQKESSTHGNDIARIFEKIKQEETDNGFRIYKSRLAVCPGMLILVPKSIYQEDNINNYLKNFYPPSKIAQSFIKQDILPDIEAFGLYLIPKIWQDHFESLEPKAIIRHSLTTLIQYALKQIPASDFVLALIEENQMQIVVIKKGQLVLANVYSCEKGDAYLYYLNLAYELHELSREHDPLYLGGQIEKESELYDLIFRYFRYVHFTAENMDYIYHRENVTPHQYLNIHTLNLCE